MGQLPNFTLERAQTAVLLIDVQEKLFPLVAEKSAVQRAMQKALQGFQILRLPLFVTEQYPQGLGATVAELHLPAGQLYLSKTTFSCLADPQVRERLLAQPSKQWILLGIEAHVCVLQSAKELLKAGKQVVVLNDAISSRTLSDLTTAVAEMRDLGIRVTSTETALFELLGDSKTAEFKQLSALIKS